jgi:DNA-directed RNA polymerase subunit RPC12/RpoP
MDNIVTCPDCNSQDVQEIIKNQQVFTSKKNWKGFGLVLLGGTLFSVVGMLIFHDDMDVGIWFSGLFWVSIIIAIIVLNRKKEKTDDKSYHYYVCRKCGSEFH